jgi:hypothetical protein
MSRFQTETTSANPIHALLLYFNDIGLQAQGAQAQPGNGRWRRGSALLDERYRGAGRSRLSGDTEARTLSG